ncbi:MAG: hypothetical protein V1820_00255 [archaeon]
MGCRILVVGAGSDSVTLNFLAGSEPDPAEAEKAQINAYREFIGRNPPFDEVAAIDSYRRSIEKLREKGIDPKVQSILARVPTEFLREREEADDNWDALVSGTPFDVVFVPHVVGYYTGAVRSYLQARSLLRNAARCCRDGGSLIALDCDKDFRLPSGGSPSGPREYKLGSLRETYEFLCPSGFFIESIRDGSSESVPTDVVLYRKVA